MDEPDDHKYSVPDNPYPDGRRRFHYITNREFERVISEIDLRPGIVEDLTGYAVKVRAFQNYSTESDEAADLSTPDSILEVGSIIEDVTSRPKTRMVAVEVILGYLKLKGLME